jgi:hypothetical protein
MPRRPEYVFRSLVSMNQPHMLYAVAEGRFAVRLNALASLLTTMAT